jgi:hypothetical protein
MRTKWMLEDDLLPDVSDAANMAKAKNSSAIIAR